MSRLHPYKIFCFGLDNAGKTSLVHFIKTGLALDDPKPSLAFGIEELVINDLNFRMWDAPGQVPYRKLWGKGMDSANIALFVLDTSEKSRYKEAKQVLNQFLNEPLAKNAPLVFCFHKMDLPESQGNYNEAAEFFGLHSIMQRDVFVHFTSIRENGCREKVQRRLDEIVRKFYEKS